MLTGSEIIILTVEEAKKLVGIINSLGDLPPFTTRAGLEKIGRDFDIFVRLRDIVRFHSGEL